MDTSYVATCARVIEEGAPHTPHAREVYVEAAVRRMGEAQERAFDDVLKMVSVALGPPGPLTLTYREMARAQSTTLSESITECIEVCRVLANSNEVDVADAARRRLSELITFAAAVAPVTAAV